MDDYTHGANGNCSLNNHDFFGGIDAARALPLPGPQIVVAHLPLYPARVDPMHEAILDEILQERVTSSRN